MSCCAGQIIFLRCSKSEDFELLQHTKGNHLQRSLLTSQPESSGTFFFSHFPPSPKDTGDCAVRGIPISDRKMRLLPSCVGRNDGLTGDSDRSKSSDLNQKIRLLPSCVSRNAGLTGDSGRSKSSDLNQKIRLLPSCVGRNDGLTGGLGCAG